MAATEARLPANGDRLRDATVAPEQLTAAQSSMQYRGALSSRGNLFYIDRVNRVVGIPCRGTDFVFREITG